MEKGKFLGKLLEAIIESSNRHNNARTKDEFQYWLGKKHAYKHVLQWYKEALK